MGEVFAGRYELVDPIGRGGVGAVWRAWDHRRRRYVAAKVLQQRDAHSLLRFVREQALRIDHPHVLAPASWAADDDQVLFTMDLVAGGSLVHLVGDYGPLPPAFVCTLLDQLLSGLAAVHGEGVVHRDIKPANLLLEATGTGRPRLRLSDFGIAMRLGEPRLTETNLVVGTPGYLAPEQMMGAEPDFPADLFAVGLVALYLLEGAKPDAKALIQYFAAHGTPSAPTGIPEPLWQVVATLLQPDPVARFRTATGARKALAAAAELLPEPSADDELIEIFDQLGPLPPGFAVTGPLKRAPGVEVRGGVGSGTGTGTETGSGSGPGSGPGTGTGTGSGSGPGFGTASGADSGTGSGAEVGAGTSSGAGNDSSAAAAAGAAAGTGASGVSGARTDTGSSVNPVPPTDPRQATSPRPQPTPSSQPPSMSDTGSFHLPPPEATPSSPRTTAPQPPQPQHHAQAHPHPQPAYASPHDPTHVLSSPRPWTQSPQHHRDHRDDASTASYTAQDPRVPPHAQEFAPDLAPRDHRTAHRARRRPGGPPAKVAVPLLLLALACYAVGFWALTRI
ncbi:protein kinase domain-containing protein [Streptomyces cylindrosporus]|uniref:non-specific serine/threonine protein kinase n=1 Tax=Streptomyces cylindrosporus TaxID=2927583 RepID=A0ABS9YCR6_9ACTN|nr:serine/threonine-protein kinase [Streptomyces cylindrosporus]MCI3274739.1 protein kinase [Streptomyces cylindrosporus]